MRKQNQIELLIKLRSEWIKWRDTFPPDSMQWLKLHFGVYALDEAIHSLETDRVWRYKAERDISLDYLLNQRR